MTSPPPPLPPGRPVAQAIRPLRDLAAYALVAAPAVWLFVAVIQLIPSGVGQDFLTRVQNSFFNFVNIELVVLPLAAVLLATMIQPMHKHAKLITIAALAEYAVAAFFAIIFGFLIALVKIADWSARAAFEQLLIRVAWLAVFAAAAYAVFLIWRNLYYTPKPKPQPGMYGQPPQWQQQYGQPGYPQPQPGQPGFPQPQPGQPGFPPPGYPGYPPPGPMQPGSMQPQNQQAGPTQPLHPAGQPQPGQWGQPPAAQGWGTPGSSQQTVTPASAPPAQPVSAQPASGGAPGTPPGPFAPAPGHPQVPGAGSQPAYPPPAYGQPGPQPGGYADPTQTIAHHDPDDADRTRVVGDDPPPRS